MTKGRLKLAELDPQHLKEFWISCGLAVAQSALDQVNEKHRTAGFTLAMTIIAKEAAEQRSRLQRKTLAAVAKAGFDLATCTVATVIEGQEVFLEITEEEEGEEQ